MTKGRKDEKRGIRAIIPGDCERATPLRARAWRSSLGIDHSFALQHLDGFGDQRIEYRADDNRLRNLPLGRIRVGRQDVAVDQPSFCKANHTGGLAPCVARQH